MFRRLDSTEIRSQCQDLMRCICALSRRSQLLAICSRPSIVLFLPFLPLPASPSQLISFRLVSSPPRPSKSESIILALISLQPLLFSFLLHFFSDSFSYTLSVVLIDFLSFTEFDDAEVGAGDLYYPNGKAVS